MNNLLRTLTESQVKPAADLRLLLTTVKEGRRQSVDTKLSDPFYDSLEGLLTDLRTITIDNRDAEAFLKPVSKSEVPDYYDVITNPMDFQTMLKKVKSKQYKSKREFQDDLDQIWTNCYTYNAAENHPLRQCVNRLKTKAERLLKYITDRKERTDPSIPSDLPSPTSGVARPKINGVNGYLNGNHHHRHSHSRSSSMASKSSPFGRSGMGGMSSGSIAIANANARKLLQDFPDMPALVRTQEGMKAFVDLDGMMHSVMDFAGTQLERELDHRLRGLVPLVQYEEDVESSQVHDGAMMDVEESGVGDKRKLNGSPDRRPKKRARVMPQYPTPLVDEKDNLSQLWWGAVQSDALVANGLPGIPFGPSTSQPKKVKKRKVKSQPVTTAPLAGSSSMDMSISPSPIKQQSISPRKRIKRENEEPSLRLISPPATTLPPPPPPPHNPKSLLTMMNSNIKTIRRVRHTHHKFQALTATSGGGMMDDEDGDMPSGPGPGMGGGGSLGPSFSGSGGAGPSGSGIFAGIEDEVVNDKIDELPWTVGGRVRAQEGRPKKGKGKEKEKHVGGIELGEANASDCLHWAGGKVLEHVGFQGASKVALDVFADIAAEYLGNVGRTIKYLTDKFGKRMTPEEIILHTLFESGSSKVQDLERYISDDIERYGNRLGDLEKKLVNAYRDTTAGESLEDEGLFEEEDEEEMGALAVGEFADVVGDDFFGLGELGIAAELGLSALTVPKRLLKGKKGANKPTAAKPSEPPPPYPPPPPFIPLTAGKVEEQIGLLKPFYQDRLKTLISTAQPAQQQQPHVIGGYIPPPHLGPSLGFSLPPLLGPVLPPLPGPSLQPLPTAPPMEDVKPVPPLEETKPVVVPSPPPDTVIPDDTPPPTQMKMGPLGQILKPSTGGTAGKKKGPKVGAAGAGAGAGTAGGAGDPGPGPSTGAGAGPSGTAAPTSGGDGSVGEDSSSPTKKKKPNMGIGSGNGRKKKPEGAASLLPVVIASA